MEGGEAGRLVLMGLDGTVTSVLVDGARPEAFGAYALSPDGERLIYAFGPVVRVAAAAEGAEAGFLLANHPLDALFWPAPGNVVVGAYAAQGYLIDPLGAAPVRSLACLGRIPSAQAIAGRPAHRVLFLTQDPSSPTKPCPAGDMRRGTTPSGASGSRPMNTPAPEAVAAPWGTMPPGRDHQSPLTGVTVDPGTRDGRNSMPHVTNRLRSIVCALLCLLGCAQASSPLGDPTPRRPPRAHRVPPVPHAAADTSDWDYVEQKATNAVYVHPDGHQAPRSAMAAQQAQGIPGLAERRRRRARAPPGEPSRGRRAGAGEEYGLSRVSASSAGDDALKFANFRRGRD